MKNAGESTESLFLLGKLNADLKKAAKKLTHGEARFLVDLYYQMQEYRKRAGNQKLADEQGKDDSANQLLGWVFGNMKSIENNIKTLLGTYARTKAVGEWSLGIHGIGPVISAGLLAHINPEIPQAAGKIMRFAGLDPSSKWVGSKKATEIVSEIMGDKKRFDDSHLISVALRINRRAENLRSLFEKMKKHGRVKGNSREALIKVASLRPWNAKLKTLCWKIGESFVKVHNNEKDFYGKIYAERKAMETAKNEAGEYRSQAEQILIEKKFGKTTEAYGHLSSGKLPPAQIHARAKRYAVKLFLSHWHWVAFESRYGETPASPYIIEHGGHRDFIPPPNWNHNNK